uniref:ELYS domain-containing protein n=1 Tax=Heterorhabditis bacteriophora TaxID=37862 RepID=A0A1I7XLY0_HETBA
MNILAQRSLSSLCPCETVDSLGEEQPNFHKVLPEWLALMHECHSSDEDYSPFLKELKQISHQKLPIRYYILYEFQQPEAVLKHSNSYDLMLYLINCLAEQRFRDRVGELLVQEKSAVINVEHLIATILNPRLNRKLSMICTDQERVLPNILRNVVIIYDTFTNNLMNTMRPNCDH